MRAVVFGATGHVGNAVVRELLDRGVRVTAAGRRPAPGANLEGLDVAYVRADHGSVDQVEQAVRGHELVVDASAPYRLESFLSSAASGRSPQEAAVGRTEALLWACDVHGARLAHVSSFVTRPVRRDLLDDLQARVARRLHPYFGAKEAMERLVLDHAAAGLPAVVVNPTYCLGPWDAKPRETCLVPQVLTGRLPAIVSHGINVVDVRDVARALLAAVESERHGEAILVSGHELTVSSLVARICEAGGGRPPTLRAPATLAAWATAWGDALLAASGARTSQAALAALLLLQQAPVPLGRAQRELGVVPRPLSRTIRDAVRWYRQVGYC